ncbi:MAG: NAD(P)H-dependent oxidoreductase subunit E [Acidobacteria bacterium]|jgi:NADH-quinone oxidoreductase subunit E|nr:NAD(P)H-dependent oxidoreductase subunit E [Acidobacteriota bacterium]
MSVLASKLLADKEFAAKIDALKAKYPEPRTALLACLHLCQDELRHIPAECQAFIAERLGLAPAHVRGVVTFYEMYSEKPLGKYLLQVCKTLPCMLAGSEVLLEHMERKLGLKPGQTTKDGRFTLVTVECLACCDGGPALMVNDELYKNVSPERADEILKELE